MIDVIVVGGGPAGMTAALYALRNGKSALVIEKTGFGGQITHSPKVENYPGTLSMSGNEFADRMLDQILAQGAQIEFEHVISVTDEGDHKVITTEEGSRFEGRTVVLATGVRHRMLGLEGEEELVGEGISFCAVCDGDFYTGRKVCMAGGGNSALQEAILLSEKCSEVVMLQDLPHFTGEENLQKVLFSRPNVKALTGVKITRLLKDGDSLCGVEITRDGQTEQITCDGLLNSYGYFDTDERCRTKTPGIFVAGDCRSKGVRQLTTAVADGATAALAACRYISEQS